MIQTLMTLLEVRATNGDRYVDRNHPGQTCPERPSLFKRSTDPEWAVLEPRLPRRSGLGRPPQWSLRMLADAMLYILRSGQPWRMLPRDFPPMSTVQRYFYAQRDQGVCTTINHLLLMECREMAGQLISASAGVIDSQRLKTTESGGPSGYDAGKKIKGRKRHILTDTNGFLVAAQVHTADIQDRYGAPDLLASVRFSFLWLRHVFADGGYAGDKLRDAMAGHGDWVIDIIKRSDIAKGFVLPPRRWVVERTFAWLGRNRRLAKDFEKAVETSTTWLLMASV